MATLNTKVKKYLEANSKTWDAEKNNIVFQNDGSGDYIKSWNVSDLNKPTDAQLSAVEDDADKMERNGNVDATRINTYGNIADQLDEIYHDIDAWRTRIQKIKTDNPKES